MDRQDLDHGESLSSGPIEVTNALVREHHKDFDAVVGVQFGHITIPISYVMGEPIQMREDKMPVNIHDDNVLSLMAELEGPGWLDQQRNYCNRLGGVLPPATSFAYAQGHYEGESCEIYGSGGIRRWFVKQDGTIVLSGAHTDEASEKRAAELGFEVRPLDRAALQRAAQKESDYSDERQENMEFLCEALIYEVTGGMGISPSDVEEMRKEDPTKFDWIKTMMAGRINSWVNHRLGIVSNPIMERHVYAAQVQAEGEGAFHLTGDLYLRLEEQG
jgi:hypothetical protein